MRTWEEYQNDGYRKIAMTRNMTTQELAHYHGIWGGVTDQFISSELARRLAGVGNQFFTLSDDVLSAMYHDIAEVISKCSECGNEETKVEVEIDLLKAIQEVLCTRGLL